MPATQGQAQDERGRYLSPYPVRVISHAMLYYSYHAVKLASDKRNETSRDEMILAALRKDASTCYTSTVLVHISVKSCFDTFTNSLVLHDKGAKPCAVVGQGLQTPAPSHQSHASQSHLINLYSAPRAMFIHAVRTNKLQTGGRPHEIRLNPRKDSSCR